MSAVFKFQTFILIIVAHTAAALHEKYKNMCEKERRAALLFGLLPATHSVIYRSKRVRPPPSTSKDVTIQPNDTSMLYTQQCPAAVWNLLNSCNNFDRKRLNKKHKIAMQFGKNSTENKKDIRDGWDRPISLDKFNKIL